MNPFELLADLLDPEWITRQVTGDDAVPFIAWTIVAFSAGMLSARLIDRRQLVNRAREMDYRMKVTLSALMKQDIELTYLDPVNAAASGDTYEDMYEDRKDANFILAECASLDGLHAMGLARFETTSGWERLWRPTRMAKSIVWWNKHLLDGTDNEADGLLRRIDEVMA